MTERYTFDDLVRVMARLRAPAGCPWDRAQTPLTLRPYLLEETYEALDALDRGEPDAVQEELGDLLLQVVFQAQMASEAGTFTVEDVIHGLVIKLIVRHPHVFGEGRLDTADAVKEHWEDAKRATRRSTFEGIPRALPALALAQKVQERVRGLGFRWPDARAAVAKVLAELGELKAALEAEEPRAVDEELGDVLFTIVNVALFARSDAEQALRDGVRKFIERFEQTQRLADVSGKPLHERSLEEMLALWDQAKSTIR